jgi:uroporphyrinogen decarboxylase
MVMTRISHRDRALAALNHQEPDRTPIDFGGASPTRIKRTAYVRLVEHLGISSEGAREQGGELADVMNPSEAVLERLDVDFRGLYLRESVGSTRLDANSYTDEYGVLWGRIREGQNFIVRRGPLQRDDLTVRDVERHAWPNGKDPARVEGLRAEALRLRGETDCALVLNLRSSVVERTLFLRGFTEFLTDLMLNPALVQAVLEHMLQYGCDVADTALREVGDLVDVVEISDDMAGEDRPFFSPETFRTQIKPYLRKLVDSIKSRTKAKIVQHNDGAIFDLIGDLIDVGIDAINPAQVSARGMGDTKRLKQVYGDNMCFWGGIDTHRLLPFGTPEQVASETKKIIDDLGREGGLVLASVHNIQDEVPPANVVAMFDTATNYRLSDNR